VRSGFAICAVILAATTAVALSRASSTSGDVRSTITGRGRDAKVPEAIRNAETRSSYLIPIHSSFFRVVARR
jgi:hypothetical protein